MPARSQTTTSAAASLVSAGRRLADLEAFHSLLAQLEANPHQGLALGNANGQIPIAARGVCFLREGGELRACSSVAPRVVHVGTHAVVAGARSTLWSRLLAHRGTRAGGGNHRSSKIRRLVGEALLERDGDQVLSWAVGAAMPDQVRQTPAFLAAEQSMEAKVSQVLRTMTFVWVDVPDEPAPTSERAAIERNAVALLSNRRAPIDPPGPSWLGRYSPRLEIRDSGLWNVDFVDDDYDPAFLDVLERAVRRTIARQRAE
jgi:hypothetical protein